MGLPSFDDSTLPDEVQNCIRSELRDGEQLVWVGQPLPGRFARWAWFRVIWSIPWVMIPLILMVASLVAIFGGNVQGGEATYWVLLVFAIPFLSIGLANLSAPYWARRRGKRTIYAITNQRAIVWEGKNFRPPKVHSFGPADLTQLRRVEYSDSVGDLIFGDHIEIPSLSGMVRSFVAIDGVQEVEKLLRKAVLADHA